MNTLAVDLARIKYKENFHIIDFNDLYKDLGKGKSL